MIAYDRGGREGGMIVYADILFIINFSMDYLALYLLGAVTAQRRGTARLTAASLFGGFVGCLSVLFLSGIHGVLAGLAASVVMTYISYGDRRRLVRNSLILWGIGTLLGGIMTFIMTLGHPVYIGAGQSADGAPTYGCAEFVPVFAMCLAASFFLMRLFCSTGSKCSAEVSCTVCGETISFTALVDTGCLVTEPISGMPVVISSRAVFPEISRQLSLPDAGGLSIRIIPAHGLCGSTVMRGFIPDKLIVDGYEVEAVLALGEQGGFGGYDGIVPARLAHHTAAYKRQNHE